jgi:hypothetical protein
LRRRRRRLLVVDQTLFIDDDQSMLTFKQSVVLLVGIITVLALIAIGTGLSPLYWPRPAPAFFDGNTSATVVVRSESSSSPKTTVATRSITRKTNRGRAMTAKRLVSTTVKLTTTTTTTVSTNASIPN